MAVDRSSTTPPRDPEHVIEVLDDDACREIVSTLEEPMTASEISDEAEVPLSTAYRKLERLTDTSLVSERTQLRPGGHHRSRYITNFERIGVELDENRDFSIDIARPSTDPEGQLLDLWSELRHET